MSTHRIHVFISHSWSYSDHYDKLAEWIFGGNWSVGQASLEFLDFSVPKDDPIHYAQNATQLKKAILAKIARSHVVVIPTGMYVEYSNWIQKEIDGCQEYDKKLLAVNPWGQERKSSLVLNQANDNVGWNKDSVISKIWRLYNS